MCSMPTDRCPRCVVCFAPGQPGPTTRAASTCTKLPRSWADKTCECCVNVAEPSYLYGGLGFGNESAGFDDVYVLSLPSFTWIKMYPRPGGSVVQQYPHNMLSCNVIDKGQMLIIGGSFPLDQTTCDAPEVSISADRTCLSPLAPRACPQTESPTSLCHHGSHEEIF